MKIFPILISPKYQVVKVKSVYQPLQLQADSVSFGIGKKEPKDYYDDMLELCKKNPGIYLPDLKLRAGKSLLSFLQDSPQEEFFKFYKDDLMLLARLEDEELNKHLLKMNSKTLFKYLDELSDVIESKAFPTFKAAFNCPKADGEKLSVEDKLNLISIFKSYLYTHSNLSGLKSMIECRSIDTEKLKEDLLKDVMCQYCGYSKNEIETVDKENLSKWDFDKIHLLCAQSMEEYNTNFDNLVRIVNNGENLKNQIHSKGSFYQKFNHNTEYLFNEVGLNYDKWLTPPDSANVNIKTFGEYVGKLEEINEGFCDNVNALRQTPAKTFIDKKYKNFIKDDKFCLPETISTKKQELEKFIRNFQKELEPVWNRTNKSIKMNSQDLDDKNPIFIKVGNEQMLIKLSKMADYSGCRDIDLTIKMWDRIPQKDLFQGNYSNCCIGMGAENGNAMQQYLLYTAFNMIELVDNTSGKTIGNALCFMGKDDDSGKPIFIVDNIIIDKACRYNDKTNLKIRDCVFQYAKNLTKELSPNEEIPIYFGYEANTISTKGLRSEIFKHLSLLGSVNTDLYYIDILGGWFPLDRTMPSVFCELLKFEKN